MSTAVTTSSKKTPARKASAARKVTVLSKRKSTQEPTDSKVLIKPLFGKDAFELMKKLGILTASGKATAAYR